MKKLLLALLSISGLYAQNEPNLIFANKEQNSNYGGSIGVTLSAKDALGNTYLAGTFSNVADFDPTSAERNLTAVGASDAFVAVYDSNGNCVGAQNIGGTGTVTPSAITISGGFIYLAGIYTNTIDFDPAIGVSNLTNANPNGSGFLAKYDLNGNFVTSKSIDGNGAIRILDIKLFNNTVVITGGFFASMDFDPSASTRLLASIGNEDAFIAKYDTNLLLSDAINIGNISAGFASSVALDASGNAIISGTYLGTVDFDPSTGTTALTSITNTISHTFIAKYDSNLAFQWVKDIGGRNSATGIISKLVLDGSSNILITGQYNQTSDFDPSVNGVSLTAAGSDIFIAKYDSNGNYVWVKKIGGTAGDIGRNIAIDATNNIYIIGNFSGIVNFDPNTGTSTLDSLNGTTFFAKYDNNGSYVFAANLANNNINTIIVDNSNAVIIAGIFNGLRDFDPSAATANLLSVSTNGYIAKYTSTGDYTFAKLIGGDKPINQVFSLIGTDALNNIYRVGSLSAVTDLDPTPAVFNVSSVSTQGVFMAKYTPNGSALLWGRSLSAPIGGTLALSVMNTDASGNTYITGRFSGTVDFDPSSNTANLTNVSSTTLSDFFMAKYDSNGNYLWAKQLGTFSAGAKRMLFDSLGNFYFVARVNGTAPIDFDPSAATASYTPQGGIDIVLAKYSPNGDYIWAKGIGGSGASLNETHIELKGNSLYVTGLFNGSVRFNPATNDVVTLVGNLNGFIAKYDLNGDYQFAYPVAGGTTGTNSTVTYNVIADEVGNFYLFTSLNGTADFDLLPTSTSFITSPVIASITSTTYIVSKYSPTAGLIWAKSLNQSSALGLAIGQFNVHGYIHNNTLIYAYTLNNNGIDLDPSANEFIVTSNPAKINLVLSKYDSNNGNFVFGNKVGGDYTVNFNSSSFDTNKNLLLSGGFQGTADFDLSAAVENLTSASPNNQDRFYVKYNSNTVLGLEDNVMGKSFVIYPNPAKSILNIDTASEPTSIKIYDLLGKTAIENTVSKAIDISRLTPGLYFVEVQSIDGVSTQKFIKN